MNPTPTIKTNEPIDSPTSETSTPPTAAEFSHRLIPLCDGRPGLRAALQIDAQANTAGQEPGSAGPLPVIDFVSSSATLDRYDEIIRPEGWHLDNYRRNPVFQNAHQYGDIIFTLGKALITEIRTTPTPHLFQRIEFAVDVNPMARIAYGLYRDKFLNAVSVGFIPLRWTNADGAEHTARELSELGLPSDSAGLGAERKLPGLAGAGQRQARRVYLEQELLEVSAVGIPANPEALQLGLKAGAVEKADLQALMEMLFAQAEDRTSHAPASAGLTGMPPLPGSFSSSVDFVPAAPNAPACAPGVRGNGAQLLQLARALRELLRRS